MKTLRAALALVPLLGASSAEELRVLPVAPGEDPPSIEVSESAPTCLEFPAPPSSQTVQGFQGRLLSEGERLCLQGTPERESALEVEVEKRRWRFPLVRGEGGLYQVRLLPPKEIPASRAEAPPPAPKALPSPNAATPSPPPPRPASAETKALGAALRVAVSLDPNRRALLLDLILVNRSAVPLVAENVEVRWSEKRLATEAAQAFFSSGKRGWIPPGGSATLRLEVPVAQLSPLPGLLEVAWPITAMDAALSREVASVAFQLEWIPIVQELNR